jgi:hypothetical protein
MPPLLDREEIALRLGQMAFRSRHF